MYEVTCKECGKKYYAKVNRDGYCEVCRSNRIANTRHNCYKNSKADRNTVKDTLIKCEYCGKLFTPVNSAQKYCKSCRPLKEQEYRTAATNSYRKENNDVIQFKVRKGERDKLKRYAGSKGLSLTDLIISGIELMKNYDALPAEVQKEIDEIMEKHLSDNKAE